MLSFNLTHISNTSLIPIEDSELSIQLALLRNHNSKNVKKYVNDFLKKFIHYVLIRISNCEKLTVYLQDKIRNALNTSNTKDIIYLMRYFKVSVNIDQVLKNNSYFISECSKFEITIL